MNYNYKHVVESVLPRTKKQILIDAFMERYESPTWKHILDSKIDLTEQANMLQALVNTAVFSNMNFSTESRIWNVYCFANWDRYLLMQSEVDQYGRIKYKDIGYVRPVLSEWDIDQQEPLYKEDIIEHE